MLSLRRFVVMLTLMCLSVSLHAHGSHASQWMPPPTLSLSASPKTCLALAIYRESRGESTKGQAAVGYVITNRVRSGKYPPTICAVVMQTTHVRGRTTRVCQFNWACQSLRQAKVHVATYRRAEAIAEQVLNRSIPNPVGDAIYFHESRARFRSARNVMATVSIGRHKFYRDRSIVLAEAPSR